MLIIASETLRQIYEILDPLLDDEVDRRPLLERALGFNHPVLGQIEFGGPTQSFVSRAVRKLIEYGEVSRGQQAIWAVLTYLRDEALVGTNIQEQISALEQIVNPPRYSTPSVGLPPVAPPGVPPVNVSFERLPAPTGKKRYWLLVGAGLALLIGFIVAGNRPTDVVNLPTSATSVLLLPTRSLTSTASQTRTPTLAPSLTSQPSATASHTPSQTALPGATVAPESRDFYATAFAINLTLTATLQTPTPVPASATFTPTPTYSQTPDPTATYQYYETLFFAERLQAQQTATLGFWLDPATLKPTLISNGQWQALETRFDGIAMVFVPAGCFLMGSNNHADDERPASPICIEKSFWLDTYEVSNGQFSAFDGVARSSGTWRKGDYPRETVSWFEARAFCSKRGGRLPTEAEWEYAARGVESWQYPWGNDFIAENLVVALNPNSQSAAVGSRPEGVSWVGAMDLSGNVREWVSTIYDPAKFAYPYRNNDGREWKDDLTRARVVRGGAWSSTPYSARSAYRSWLYPDSEYSSVGFRCARNS
jgi:formylglycine-generating enzyme required for sulfatase activity